MNLRQKMKISFQLLLFAWTALPAVAQQGFKYKASLQRVDSSKFYRIVLQPALTAKCQPDLADIRLIDESGKIVPYLTGRSLPVQGQITYLQLPEISNVILNDSLPSYVAENASGMHLNQLWIKLRNTAANRTVNLQGSDDLKQWFAIKEHVILQGTSRDNGTSEELIEFPVSTYRYFKIQVDGSKRIPVKILQTGIYLNHQTPSEYTQIPVARFTNEQKANTTLINIIFRESYRINKLHLKFSGAKYFHRRIQLYSIKGERKEWLMDSLVSSAGNGELYLDTKSSKLQLAILNEDNPHLTLQMAEAYELKQSLIAYLENQHHYELYFGNDKAQSPRFDLNSFTDSIGSKLPVVNHSEITQVAHSKDKSPSAFLPAWILWITGGMALLLLLVITLKMTREISKTEK